MMGISIVALVIGVVVFVTTGSAAEQRQTSAEKEAQVLRRAVQSWRTARGAGCPTLSQLREDGYLKFEQRTDDPWGEHFRVRCVDDVVTILSAGPDGRFDSADDVSVSGSPARHAQPPRQTAAAPVTPENDDGARPIPRG
jgi:general secretion pathway protein G